MGPSPIQHDTLRRLLDVSRRLGNTPDLGEILSVIIDAMRDLLQARRATVFEYDAGNDQLVATVAHGLEPDVLNGTASSASASSASSQMPEVRFPAGAGIAGAAAQTRRIVNVPDAYADARFNPEVDRRTGFRTESILSIPLCGIDGELIGVAQVLNKIGGAFDEADEAVAEALAAQAAVAIKRARLIQDQLARQKLERDLELARTIQQATFPNSLPDVAEYEIATWSESADSTGGDAYDVIATGEAGAEVLFLLADATGHGIGPALLATEIRAMLRMAARLDADLNSMAEHLNSQLCEDTPAGYFVTGWLGLLNPQTHLLQSFSAGQAPLFHVHARERTVEERAADTVPFGIIPDIDASCVNEIDLEPGDIFAVMSDGICEAGNLQHQQFGSERIMAALCDARLQTAEAIVRELLVRVHEFCGEAPAKDDRTILLIKRLA